MMKFFRFFFGEGFLHKEKDKNHKDEVRRATIAVLEKYDKTFKDLARYDRGEKVFNPISN